LVSLPGEEPAAAAAPIDDVLDSKVKAAIASFIAKAKGGKVKKADLPSLVFGDPALLADPQRNDIINLLVADDNFITAGAAQGLWAFGGGVISKAA